MAALATPQHLLVVDTARPDEGVYLDFAELAAEVGFQSWYLPLDELLDRPLGELTEILQRFGLVFFALSSPLLAGLRAGTPPSRAVQAALAARWKARVGITGLMFPPLSLAAGPERPLRALAPVLETVGVDVDDEDGPAYSFLRYAADPLGRTAPAQPWHTTLLLPRPASHRAEPELVLSTGTDPLGVLWRDPATGNHLLGGSAGALTFGSLSEDFQLLPMDPEKGRALRATLRPALARCAELLRERQPVAPAPHALVRRLARPYIEAPTVPADTRPLRKVAWMETTFFEEDWARAYQQIIVDYALRGGWDALWLGVAPNQYLSPIARYAERAERMWAGLAELCRLLVLEGQRRGARVPALLVSFHPVNNLVGAHERPARPARDLFGVDYPDVPAPLDLDFWRGEVVDPIERFAARWPEVACGLPLGGVLLDLELYFRNLSGVSSFGSTMGFEPETISRIGAELGLGPHLDLRGLLASRRLGDYFARLEAEAEQLGRTLRATVERVAPGGRVAAYGTTLHLDWFHAGLYRGLGTALRPLDLFTFASDGARHQPLLRARGIHVFHAAALMQSKLTDPADLTLVDGLLAHNDGLWLNRLSRVEPYDPTKWHALEQTPLDAEGRARLHDALRAL